ncbi:MAG: hypothetical protein JXA09_01045 [Anaerolineae bacterium]|nr:hypothetical protein [Anaerolineae bacterium]
MRKVRLFVSSSPDLVAEREVVSQVVAQLPLTIGWQIDHTPLPGEGAPAGDARAAACDLYVMLVGQDFAAPMGAELARATRAERQRLYYRKLCAPSPSAQDAVRRVRAEWRSFSTLDALRRWFQHDLLQALLRRAEELGLDMVELERLLSLAQEETGALQGPPEPGAERGEAGRSGIILGREVWEGER